MTYVSHRISERICSSWALAEPGSCAARSEVLNGQGPDPISLNFFSMTFQNFGIPKSGFPKFLSISKILERNFIFALRSRGCAHARVSRCGNEISALVSAWRRVRVGNFPFQNFWTFRNFWDFPKFWKYFGNYGNRRIPTVGEPTVFLVPRQWQQSTCGPSLIWITLDLRTDFGFQNFRNFRNFRDFPKFWKILELLEILKCIRVASSLFRWRVVSGWRQTDAEICSE